jgi:DNA repair exonuclease SbcCD ATPase subunit
MIQVTEIGIKGVGPFTKGQRLPVLKGVSYVYGLNRVTGEANSNAAGKTLLTSSLGEVLYDAPMVGTKADKVKKGVRYVKFLRRGKAVEVRRAGNKLTVAIDDKIVAGTKTKTMEALRKLWPISEEEFRTYGYLASHIAHPLVMGTSTQRRAFFSEFFGLEQLAQEKKIVLRELARLKEARATFVEAQANYELIRNDCLDKASLEEIKITIGRLERKVEKVVEQANRASEVRRLLSVKSMLPKNLDSEVTEDDVDQARYAVRKAQRSESQLEDYKIYLREKARFEEATKDLPEFDLGELEEAVEAHRRASAVVLPEQPTNPGKPEKPTIELGEATRRVEKLEHELAHIQQFKSGVCDKCGQAVQTPRSVKQVRAALNAAEEAVKLAEQNAQASKAYAEYKKADAAWKEARTAYLAACKTAKELAPKVELYKKVSKLPHKPEKVLKPKVLDLATAEKQLELLSLSLKHKDDLVAIKGLTRQDIEEAEASGDAASLVRLQDKLSTLRSRLAQHESVYEKVRAQKARLAELTAQLEDEEVLRALLKGYDDKAVKRLVVEAISEHFMEALNSYSGLVFPGYKFTFDWTATQVSLLVTRPGHEPTDVRSLSGAESKLFTLIAVMALLKFVPATKRLSLIILDEPTASFGPQSTEMFHNLLPQLNKLIPSIIIVTPRTEEYYPGAHKFTVVRDQQGARICR